MTATRTVNRPSYPRAVQPRANAPSRRWWPGNEDTVPGVTREQAHLPAEQPPPRQDTWLPAAHADQGRARDPRRAAAQGPGPGQRMTGPDKGEVKGASRGIPAEAAE